ncbi:PREDICTED: ABC transporter C family member 10-like [Fragaria vesca subsp. vesca]|uniref:ABC transporter C family member 10-like n=1 Tax=Fragaria vesca subsp. vesca TaxID=101020 RepID=UPI0002C2DFB7|nr:PREDICTED: ABC transporter C family member 10-like [Fragaria vesca subsp. vesca]
MTGDLWTAFCGESGASESFNFQFLVHPSSCVNHALIIFLDIVLLVVLLFTVFLKSSKTVHVPARFLGFSSWQIVSAIFNGGLVFVHLCLGVWNLEEKLRYSHTVLPLNWWLLGIFQGFTWLFLSLTLSIRVKKLPRQPSRLLSILAFLFSGVVFALSLFAVIFRNEISVEIVLDILTFPGAALLLLCVFKGYKYEDGEEIISDNGLYAPLNGESNGNSEGNDHTTPFSKAGLFSRMSFWWLNSLMKRGKEKTLEDEDIPELRKEDRAESCYGMFLEQLSKQKKIGPNSQPSVLRILILCHWKEILLSGFFALLKILSLCAGPLLLNAFILVAEGNASFEHEGYLLAGALFVLKTIESLSQRQWYFRCRLIGLKVRSLLSAAIYKKQLRLSNAAKLTHSGGEIMNYVTVDAYRIGEFPFWFHQTWTTSVQLCFSLVILFRAVGLATFAALVMILFSIILNAPLAKLQHRFQSKLMKAQDERLKASSEALVNMKVLKLYAWETHFRKAIEKLRKEEHKWLSAMLFRKAYSTFLFWTTPALVSAATFGACYLLNIPLHANNIFTFISTLRLVQEPIRTIPDVFAVAIQAKVGFARIVKFLEAPELQPSNVRKCNMKNVDKSIEIKSANFSWEENSSKSILRNINLEVRPGEKVAICGEVGSGKSSLLAAILGEIPTVQGNIQVYGKIAYVSQTAWIQSGTIQENILFGSCMDSKRYRETLERCSLVKDLELLPYGDLTEIGERGVNLSGGQKQRIQLARALYQDADIYLLDDPFSAVDAHTATSLFNEYVMEALSGKTVLLVTHQVDFLPAFHFVLLMMDGEILQAAPYQHLLDISREFQDLVNAHKETAGSERLSDVTSAQNSGISSTEIKKSYVEKPLKENKGDQLIKLEERETGDTGLKPYILYLKQNKGFLYFSIAICLHFTFVMSEIAQNSWMAASVDNPNVSTLQMILVYLAIGFPATFIFLFRSLAVVNGGLETSKSIFSQLLNSLFRAPMSFYDSTPLGRVLSRVSSDLSITDIDIPFALVFACTSTINAYSNLGVLTVVTWQVLFVSIPMIYVAIQLQKYYYSTAKELMRINGITKSFVANHLTESVSGAITIRAFNEEDRFSAKNFDLIDTNASPYFHSFSANEWLIQRLEMISAAVLASAALCMVLLPTGTFSSGFVGMALSYGLSLNVTLIKSIQNQCTIANYIISVERLDQYMHIPSESPEVVEGNRPPANWPVVGKVEIQNLQIRYREDTPLVLRGISCIFEGGHKIGIVGRTGSGKSTLIGALFRLVEPAGGKIIVDGIDICTIGLHDLRSRIGIIPQDPTLYRKLKLKEKQREGASGEGSSSAS